MTEIKLNILDVCSSKMRRVIRCIPAMSNENILATRQEFFVPKAAPIQSITNLLVLDFWLMLLHLFIFLNVFYFSECDIRMSWFVFWLKMEPSIKYVRLSQIIWTTKNDYITFKSNYIQALKWRKNLKEKQHFYTDASWNYLFLNMAVWWGCISRRGIGGEGRHWLATFVW